MTDRNMPFQSAENAPLSGRISSIVRAVYLAAISMAALGWHCFIACIVLQLIYSGRPGSNRCPRTLRPGMQNTASQKLTNFVVLMPAPASWSIRKVCGFSGGC